MEELTADNYVLLKRKDHYNIFSQHGNFVLLDCSFEEANKIIETLLDNNCKVFDNLDELKSYCDNLSTRNFIANIINEKLKL